MRRILGYMLLLMICAYPVWSAVTSGDIEPAAYSTKTTLDVNLSVRFNQTAGVADTTWLLKVYNRSSSTGAYGIYNDTGHIIRNNSFWNLTSTFTEGRHWIFFNATNVSGGATASSTRIIEVDLSYYMISIGSYETINMSLDTGHINTTGKVKAYSIVVENTSTTLGNCDSSETGEIRFNSSSGTGSDNFIGCNGTGWVTLG
jgi:hypothetical protein